MEENIRLALSNNPLDDSPFAGFVILETISMSVKAYKSTLPKELSKAGIPEVEIEKLIDIIAVDLRDKYLEF